MGTIALTNNVIDSATSNNIYNNILKTTAFPASVFNLVDGYKIIAIKNEIIAINIIYTIVFAITYDIAVYVPLLYSLINNNLSSKYAGIPATDIKQVKATAKNNKDKRS